MSARFERKYRLDARRCDFLMAAWEPHLGRAPHTGAAGSYPVLSQYFDTAGLRFHREKQDGDAWRQKVRLRTYGRRFDGGGACFLEIKKRRQDQVRKSRLHIGSFRQALLEPFAWRDVAGPAAGEFWAVAETHRLRPSAQVWYSRRAYQGIADPALRVTVDSEVMALHPGERWTEDALYDGARSVLPPDEVIVEIKGPDRVPAWIHRGIRWAGLRQEPVPKYCLAVGALNLPTIRDGDYL